MTERSLMEVGDSVNILPGQYLGSRQQTKITITATIVEKYEWSWTGLSGLLVRCKPQSRPFMVNLKHSEIQQVKEQSK